MKKLLSFFIIFIPWLFSLFIITFNKLNSFLIIYIIISIIVYFIFSIYLYRIIKLDEYDNNFILNTSLLFIINQSFNICLFYYKNEFISSILFISMLIILYKIKSMY